MSDLDLYRNRSLALKKVRAWGKAHGFGPASRVLQEILSRMTANEPWAWTRLTTFEDWAQDWGYSVRTLHRHLTQLHDLGVLTSEVRASAAIRKRGEYPVYRIPDWAVSHLLEWHPEGLNGPFPGRSERAEMAHSASRIGGPECAISAHSDGQIGTLSNVQEAVMNTPETLEIPGVSPPRAGGTTTRERKREETDRVSRRLRRRRKLGSGNSRNQEDAVRVLNTDMGVDPDRPASAPTTAATPAGRLAKVFEREWDAVTVQSTHPLPSRPWAIGGKQRFYHWVNTTLLPLCGSEQVAETVIVEFCRLLRSGGIQLPRTGNRPVFDTLGRHLDTLLAKARQPSAEDRMAAIEARQQEFFRQQQLLVAENNRRLGLASGS